MEQNTEQSKKHSLFSKPGVFSIALLLGILCIVIVFFSVPYWYSPCGSPEAAAISALRTLSSAQELYNTRWSKYGNMTELHKADTIDAVLAEATTPEHSKSGYYFRMSPGEDGWSCVALPAEPGYTGERSFFIDETGEIREEPCMSKSDPPANRNSPTQEEARRREWEMELKDR